MGRSKKVDRPMRTNVSIPTSVFVPVQLELYSEVEECVPRGKLSDLITQLLAEWLKKRGKEVQHDSGS